MCCSPTVCCGGPAERTAYRIAVLREEPGRSGSRYLPEHVQPGSVPAAVRNVADAEDQRADEPFAAMKRSGSLVDWRTGLTAAERIKDVPGNHFSMVEGEVSSTALAVQEWLASKAS
jgi:hypothetical protein